MEYIIDTIFYFVEHESEYQLMRENISPKTIVFVLDSHEIYLNGWAYGKTSTSGLATETEIDDLSDTIDAVNGRIGEVSDSLNTMLTDLNGRIDDRVSDQLETADLLAKNAYLNGQIGVKLDEWKQQASLVTEDSVTWTNITGNVDSLTLSVNKVLGNFNADGSFKATQTLLSIIDNRIENSTSIAEIATSWALLDNNENVLRWLTSGFDALTIAGNNSFAALYSAGKNETTNAISTLRTEISNDYVASTELASRVTGLLNDKGLTAEAISGIASTTYVDGKVADAETNVFARRLDGAGNQSVSDLLLQANTDHARLVGLAQWKDNTNFVTSTAGLLTEAELDSAVAALIASTTSESGIGAEGAIGVAISEGISTATIQADHINLLGADVTVGGTRKFYIDGTTGAMTATDGTFSGTITSTSGNIGGFTISLDKIYTQSGGGVTLSNDGYFTLKNPDDNFTIVNMHKNGTVRFLNGNINFKVTGLNLDGTIADPETAESVVQVKDNNSQMVYGPLGVTLQSLSGQIVGWMTLGNISTLNNETTIKETASLGAGRTGYPNSDITSLTVYNQYSNVTIVSGTNDANGDETSSNEATFGVKGTIAAKDIYIGAFHHPDQWSSIASEARFHFTNSGLTVNGLSGVSGTYQLGSYYVTFTNGIVTYCDTTSPQ